jgi:hypothetical protein
MGLTFDPNDENIVSSGGTAALPARLTLFSPFGAFILPSFLGSCFLRIRNP